MSKSGSLFKQNLEKSYGEAIGKGASSKGMFKDLNKYSDEMTETDEETKKTKILAKQQFAKDLQDDPDFEEFKKRAKYKEGYKEFTYGTPNVVSSDPYIKKRKWSRPGKEEATEATGSGSSGAFSAPVAFMDSDFVKRSFAETPGVGKKIKENRNRKPFRPEDKVATNISGDTFRPGDMVKRSEEHTSELQSH